MKEIIDEFLKSIILKKVEGSVYLLPAITDVMIEDFEQKIKSQYERSGGVYCKQDIPSIQGEMVRIHYVEGGYGNGNYHTGREKWYTNDEQVKEITAGFSWTPIRKYENERDVITSINEAINGV